jgi:NAD(P)-dependent dehydrogenase (short-subunit alcohol dehydrogenase family)
VGGTSGLGRAVAEDLSARGSNVVVGTREAVAKGIAAGLDNAIGIGADIRDPEAIRDAVAQTLDRFGALHINVNPAGVIAQVPFVTEDGGPGSLEEFERLLSINLIGTFNVIRHAVPAMHLNEPDEGDERGNVIITSSGAAYDGVAGHAAYSSSKMGLIGMTIVAASCFTRLGVHDRSWEYMTGHVVVV